MGGDSLGQPACIEFCFPYLGFLAVFGTFNIKYVFPSTFPSSTNLLSIQNRKKYPIIHFLIVNLDNAQWKPWLKDEFFRITKLTSKVIYCFRNKGRQEFVKCMMQNPLNWETVLQRPRFSFTARKRSIFKVELRNLSVIPANQRILIKHLSLDRFHKLAGKDDLDRSLKL